MKLTDKQRRKLIKAYPFLQPRNLWTGKEIDDADWIVGEELPDGWLRLFLMYCKELKPHLVNSNYLDKFMFTDVKEKYGTLRLNNYGEPKSARWLTVKYERFSEYVCCLCGKLATKQTEGYIMSLCDSCSEKDCFLCWKTTKLPKKLQAGITIYEHGTSKKIFFSLKHIKKQYEYILTMSDEAFIEYMLTE